MTDSKLLTIPRICQSPSLTGFAPDGLRIAPNGKSVTYRKGRMNDKSFKDLWQMKIITDSDGTDDGNEVKVETSLLVDGDLLKLDQLSDEEKARRERLRVGESKGVLDYQWSKNSKFILIPASDKIFLYDIEKKEIENILSRPNNQPNDGSEKDAKPAEDESTTDAKLSPKGNFVAFVRNQNLHIVNLKSKQQIEITKNTEETIKNGMAEFVAQEEMSRMSGYWWSPDEKFIAFTRVDESPVTLVKRNEIYADDIKLVDQRYPSAGERNVIVKLGVVEVEEVEKAHGIMKESGDGVDGTADAAVSADEYDEKMGVKWVNLGEEEDMYLARVKWLPCSKFLSFQWQDRKQQRLDLRLCYAVEPSVTWNVIEERSNTYVNLTSDGDLMFLKKPINNGGTTTQVNSVRREQSEIFLSPESTAILDNGTNMLKIEFQDILWLSEKDGFRRIYTMKTPLPVVSGGNGVNVARVKAFVNEMNSESNDTLVQCNNLKPLYNGYYENNEENSNWQVDSIEYVDEENHLVYFSGRMHGPTYKVLYRCRIENNDGKGDENEPELVTDENELLLSHSVLFADSRALFLDYTSSSDTPPRISLWVVKDSGIDNDNEGCAKANKPSFVCWVEKNDPSTEGHPLFPYYKSLQTDCIYGWLPLPESKQPFLPLRPDGNMTIEPQSLWKSNTKIDNKLHFKLMKPKIFDSQRKYPAVIFVYGGPHVQLCSTGASWRDSQFFLQFLLQNDYVVFTLDNRGSHNKGKRFEDAIYRDLSNLEVKDQLQGVKFLQSLPFVDAERIGIYGHSYGGYMSLMCLFRSQMDEHVCERTGNRPIIKAAVSGAPVADWKLYDTHYTERYQGTPQDNEIGYTNSSVFKYCQYYDDVNTRLLIYHGMADDNVLFTNSTQIYKKLQDLGKVFQCVDYPGSKHSMDGETVKIHMYKTIFDFFTRELKR